MNLIRAVFESRRMSPGWMFPMGWFALFGVMTSVIFGLNGWVQNIVLAWTGWTTLWMFGFVGTAAIGMDSMRNMRRFGWLAISRPRFYFEFSRATLAVIFLLLGPSLTLSFLLPNVAVPGLNFVGIRNIFVVLAVLFCFMTICGYVTAFVTGRRRSGLAYECAAWFFCVFGGITLVTFGYIWIPEPPKGFWSAVLGVATCGVGVLLLSYGAFTEAMREQRSQASRR